MFLPVIEILKKNYHVFAVAVDGFDFDDDSEFDTVEKCAKDIEDWFIMKGYDHIDCLNGLSMGGGIAIRILADDRIRFRTAVIDAGITPYEYPFIITRLILLKDFGVTMIGKWYPKLMEYVFTKDRYNEETQDKFKVALKHMSAKTMWNAYDSTDNYSMPTSFPSLDTQIYYWYGQDEKDERKPDLNYVRKHIRGIHVMEIPHMAHGQFVCSEPERFYHRFNQIIKKQH